MDRFERVMSWIAVNVIVAGLMYGTFVVGYPWAENGLRFYSWIAVLSAVCCIIIRIGADAPEVKKAIVSMRGKGRPVPRLIGLVVDLIEIEIFILAGWFVTAIALIIHRITVDWIYGQAVPAASVESES